MVQRASPAVLALNVLGATAYLIGVSHGAWAIPQERAQGIYSVTGEPLVWFVYVLWIFFPFTILNLVWGSFILAYRQRRCRNLWLTTALIWFVTLCIDFTHH